MLVYSIEDVYTIKKKNSFTISVETKLLIDTLCEQIQPILIENTQPVPRKPDNRMVVKKKPNDMWNNVRVPPPKAEKNYFNEIRVCLNKLSAKNYETQKVNIFELLDQFIKEGTQEKEQKEDKEEANEEKQKELKKEKTKPDINLQTIAQSIFDIASTNKFYAEIYAQLYKELVMKYPVFSDILTTFLNVFAGNIKQLKYVDPDTDYELYCVYNKNNDSRKATVVFIVHLMKKGVISVLKVVSIAAAFLETAIEYLEETERTYEIEEITEIIFLFIQEGITSFCDCKGEWIWKFVVLKHIQTLARFKKNENKNISSRTIFKMMDITQMIAKHQKE